MEALAARYRRFAAEEARGRSPLYEALANGVAADPGALRFLLTLPPAKQQPNLLLAAVRHLHGTAPDWPWFRDRLLADQPALRATMMARATQTNEPNRCAALLPLLARLPQPLALIEIGASAGLCLLPDRYGYDYGRTRLAPAGQGAPIFPCVPDAATPLPDAVPCIAWRAGLDLNPIDTTDPDQAAWLETLVWPEQTERLARLRAALAIAARDPPRLVQGDLLGDALPRLCAEAPRDATLVVFHTAVLAYVEDATARAEFAARMPRLAPWWISNESPGVFPAFAPGPPPIPGRFLLALNGTPQAWTDPHGTAMEWIAPR